MGFRDLGFEQRFNKMGDQAEKQFESVWTRGKVRFGLDRPPIQVHKLPARIRHMPDYLTSSCLVEVTGFGRKQELAIKIDKWNVLNFWNQVHPVSIFVYDSYKDRHRILTLEEVRDLVNRPECTLGHFPEGKAYLSIPAELVFADEA